MNITAPLHPPGRPTGSAALDILDSLALLDGATTFALILDTGRERREVVVTLGNLRRRGKVQRNGALWEITRAGRLVLCGGGR
jgi:hypothetical protein